MDSAELNVIARIEPLSVSIVELWFIRRVSMCPLCTHVSLFMIPKIRPCLSFLLPSLVLSITVTRPPTWLDRWLGNIFSSSLTNPLPFCPHPQTLPAYQPSSPPNLTLWLDNSACDKCLPQFFHSLVNLKNNTRLPRVQTNFPSTLIVRDGETSLCNLTPTFHEYGQYWLRVEGEAGAGTAECTFYDVVAGRDPTILGTKPWNL